MERDYKPHTETMGKGGGEVGRYSLEVKRSLSRNEERSSDLEISGRLMSVTSYEIYRDPSGLDDGLH